MAGIRVRALGIAAFFAMTGAARADVPVSCPGEIDAALGPIWSAAASASASG